MAHRMRTSRTGSSLFPFVVAGVMTLAACGSDSDSSSDATTGATTPAAQTTAAAATTEGAATTDAAPTTEGAPTTDGAAGPATGDPVNIMTIGPTDAPGFSIPSIPVGAQIAVDEINAAGGIGGRPANLIVCNDTNDPNTASQCIRQATDEGVVAIVGGLSLFDSAIVPLLGDIPWVGLTSSSVFNNPNVFLIGGDGASAFAGIGAAAVKEGCKNIAVILSANKTPTNESQIKAGITSEGGTVATTLDAPAAGGDWAPIVASARDAGADCVASGVGPPESGPLLTAINAGEPLRFFTADGGLPDVVLQQLGAAAEGAVAVSGFLPKTSTDGIVQELAANITAAAPDVPFDQFAMTGYASVKLVAHAMKGQTDVTAKSVSSALAKVTDFDTGLGPVVDFSTPGTAKGYEGIFNPMIYMYVAKGGAYELLQPDPIDMTGALEVLAGG